MRQRPRASTLLGLAGFGNPCERCDIDHFAPGGGIHARSQQAAFGNSCASGPPGEGRPQGFPSLGESGVDHGEDLFTGC